MGDHAVRLAGAAALVRNRLNRRERRRLARALCRGNASAAPNQRRYEVRPEHRVTVADVLRDPHPLVAASVHLLRDTKANGEHRLVPRGRKCLALHVTLATVRS